MSLSFDPNEVAKKTVHAEKGLKIEILNSLADVTRQYDEKQELSIGRQTDFVTNDVANKLMAFLKTLKTDRVSIVSIGKNLAKNEKNSFDGSIDFTFKVLHAGLTKDIDLKIILKNSSFDLPNATTITARLNDVISHEANIEKDLKTEMTTTINNIEAAYKEEGLTKEAGIQTIVTQVHPVIHVQKLWLPSSLKIGDVINLEGSQYKIVSDDHNKMSSDSDGIFWTLRECVTPASDRTSEISAS